MHFVYPILRRTRWSEMLPRHILLHKEQRMIGWPNIKTNMFNPILCPLYSYYGATDFFQALIMVLSH